MAYSGEVLLRARARLEEARAEREAENARHLQQAYEMVPRLREIDRELRKTMAQAAKMMFTQGEEGEEQFHRIQQENLALQEERQWLIEDHFEEGFLDDSPICTLCGGSGYVGSEMCECLRELCRQEQRKELTVLSGTNLESFGNFRLDYYSDAFDPALGASPREVMALSFGVCKRYAQSFTLKSGNLLLNGNPGLGKTFLSACIARTVSDGGYSVVYETAGRFFAQLEKARFSGDTEAQAQAARFTACDLLIIDDLGSELVTPFVQSALYNVINERLLGSLPTVVSSNLQSQDFSQRYGPAIASRLLGGFRQVAFVGQDVRMLKGRGSF